MIVSEEVAVVSVRGVSRKFPLIWITALILAATVILAVSLRVNRPKQTRDLVAHIDSPDGRAVAAIYELSGDAKTSFLYQVEVTADGTTREVATLSGAMRNEHSYGVNLVWTGNDHLDIEYLKAQDAKVVSSEVPSGEGHVLVTLHNGVRDENAPAGGMLFHLRESEQ